MQTVEKTRDHPPHAGGNEDAHHAWGWEIEFWHSPDHVVRIPYLKIHSGQNTAVEQEVEIEQIMAIITNALGRPLSGEQRNQEAKGDLTEIKEEISEAVASGAFIRRAG